VRRGRRERGQILPIVALSLVALPGISAFAIDVGYAYYAKRQLQSATDAAAGDCDSTAKVILNGATYTENTRCVHRADQAYESPTMYSDDTVRSIASAGAFYNKATAGDLSTIFVAIATDTGSGSSRLVDDGY
jgi:uncharacterized membrane protein